MPQKNHLKNIGRLFAIYGLGYFLSKGIALVMLPIYTHYLPPSDYGILEVLELTTYIVSLILGAGLTQAMVRFYHEHHDAHSRNLAVSSVFIATTALFLVALAGLIPVSGTLSGLIFKSPGYSGLFVLVFISMLMHEVIDVSMTYFRILERPVRFISFSTVHLLLSLSLNILFIVGLAMGMKGVLIGGLISSSVIATVLSVFLVREVGFGFSWKILLPMLKYGFPLVGTWLGMYVINFSDRFALQRLLPHDTALSQVGIYSLAYKFGMLPSVLILSPFLMLWSPKQFQIVKEPDAERVFARVFTYFWVVLLFFGLGLSVLAGDIIWLIADPAYHDAARYIPLLAFSYMCYGAYSYMQFGILYQKKTRLLALVTLSMAVLNVALNLILIPIFGVMGSALATFAAIFLMTGVALLLSQRLYHIPYEYLRLTKMTVLAALLGLLAVMVEIDSIFMDIVVRSSIVLMYPVLLILTGVSGGKDFAFFRSLVGRFYNRQVL